MCGIAGVSGPNAAHHQPAVAQMLSQLVHRGPDDEGIEVHESCVLGHRRLSIIDLMRGHQPIANETGKVLAIVNGEIYNHLEIRRRLASHAWSTRSDSEAVVHLYEECGPAFPAQLRGMFAVALWDADRARLVLTRDRLGKKPLYWCRRGGRILFASELGALVEHPDVDRDPDPVALDLYLGLQYVPAPWTAYRDVHSLEPGHTLVFEKGEVQIVPYWEVPLPSRRPGITFDTAARQVREAVDDAVAVRLMSDVPLGAFLSGGVDSTIVVSSMARQVSGKVRTFCVGFDELDFDERIYARQVADRWATEHHEFVVRPDAVAMLPTIVAHHGQPFADSSALPTHYLAEMTRGEVTVALSGDGGDEVFGGYERYSAARLLEMARVIPAPLIGGAARSLSLLSRPVPGLQRVARRAHRLAETWRLPVDDAYFRWMAHFTPALKADLYTPEMSEAVEIGHHEAWLAERAARAAHLDAVGRLTRLDMQSYLPFDLLVKVDIASMTHSLEVRCPLLDHQLIELTAHFPSGWKADPFRRKRVLRAAFPDAFPPGIERRRKQGFGVPVGRWLRGPLGDFATELLQSERTACTRYVREEVIARLLDQHRGGAADNSFLLWNLMVLELWLRRFIDRTW